jgi:hypothetical protein
MPGSDLMSTPQEPGSPEDRAGPPDEPAPGPAQPPPDQPPYAAGPTGSSYGNPYASPVFGTPPPRPDRPPPKEVVWATYAMYAAIAFSLISLAVRLIESDRYKDVLRQANTGRTDVDTLYTAVVTVAVVVTLVISAGYVLLAINLRKGANSARVATRIVVVGLIVLGLLMLRSNVPVIARVFDILVLLANVAALALLAMRPSTQFFAATKQPRYPRF